MNEERDKDRPEQSKNDRVGDLESRRYQGNQPEKIPTSSEVY